jgi:two-component system, NtrC family, sensor histidine kinase HydH
VPVPWQSELRLGQTVQVSIEDDGIGLTPEEQHRIFVPFFTTKDRGTGLGLAITQRIIENHGGEIRVRSKPREGSTFLIAFDRLAGGDERSEMPATPDELPHPEEVTADGEEAKP